MWFPWSLKIGRNQDIEYDVRSISYAAILQFTDSIIFFALCFKKDTLAQVFSYEFREISKNAFFTEHLWWLLLQNSCLNGENVFFYNKKI